MSNKVIIKKQPILFNSIDEQRLSYANQLTVKSWNDIINILRVQTNTNTAYIKQLHNWLVGSTGEDITIPENDTSFVEYVLSGEQSLERLDVKYLYVQGKEVALKEDVVDLTSAQTITGRKTFSSQVTFNNDALLSSKTGVFRFGDSSNVGALGVFAYTEGNRYLRPGYHGVMDLGDGSSNGERWRNLYMTGTVYADEGLSKDGTAILNAQSANEFYTLVTESDIACINYSASPVPGKHTPSTYYFGNGTGVRGMKSGVIYAGNIYQNDKQVANKDDVVDLTSVQTITGAKRFAGTVGNVQTESGVYLGIDENVGAPNANIAITSANTAAYIDMGPPNKDYGFRLIKWNNLNGKYDAELCYGDDGSGQGMANITIPRVTGTMALTSDIPPIDNSSGVQDLGWTHADMDTPRIATANRIAHWNGAYNNTNASNLKYGVGGELAFKSDIDNVMQVAEGKTKTYVIKASDNDWVNSNMDEITTMFTYLSLITVDGKHISYGDLKIGDIILVKELDIPDRYVGNKVLPGLVTFYKMETTKIDLDVKQDTLVSGKNIRTIDGKSLLGSGDITTYNLIYANAGAPQYEKLSNVISQIRKYLNLSDNVTHYGYTGHIRYTGDQEYLNGYIDLQVTNGGTQINISYVDVLNMTYCKASGEYAVIANLGLQEFLDTYTKKYNAKIQHITKPDNKEVSSNSTYTVKQLYDEVKKTGVNMEWFRLTINFAPPHDAQGWCSLRSQVEGTYIITFTDYASNKRYAVTADDTFRLIDLCQYPYETPIPYLNAKKIYKDGYSVVTSEDLQNLKNEIKGYRASGRGSINQSDNPYVLLGVVLNKDEILKDYSQNSEIPIFKPLYLFGNNVYDYWIILNFTYTDNLINFTAMKINEGSRPRIVEGINVPDTITKYYDVTEDMYKEYTWATSEELENYLPLTGGTVENITVTGTVQASSVKSNSIEVTNVLNINNATLKHITRDNQLYLTTTKSEQEGKGSIRIGSYDPTTQGNGFILNIDNDTNSIYSNLSGGMSLGTSLGTSSKPWSSIYGDNIYQNGKQVANKEEIPTKTSQLTNDSEYTTKEDLDNYLPLSGGTITGDLNFKDYKGINLGLGSIDTSNDNNIRILTAGTKTGSSARGNIHFGYHMGDEGQWNSLFTIDNKNFVVYGSVGLGKPDRQWDNLYSRLIYQNGKQVANKEDIPTKVSQLENDSYYTTKENTGATLDVSIDNTTYVMTLKLCNSYGSVISTGTIDLPLETMVISARYEDGKLYLTTKDGNELEGIDISNIVSGLVPNTRTVNGKALSSDITLNKADVGLSNVDNTSDANKPISTATAAALALKADKTELNNYIPYNTDNAKNIYWESAINNLKFNIETPKPSIEFYGDRVGSATITPNKIELNGNSEGGPASILLDGKPVALQEKIPTKVSDLTNDNNYVAVSQIFEIGSTGQTTPSDSLAVGGIFFQEI